MTVDRRRALLFVVMFSGVSVSSFAQRLACSPIGPGESAALVAMRITGDARNRFEQWFQIFDPATGRMIPKSGYEIVHAGWSACIVDVRPQPARAAIAASSRTLDRLDSTYVLWGLLVLLIALAIRSTGDYVNDRRAVLQLMTSFGERFVQEFDRPLLHSHPSDRVIDSELRVTPHRSRVEVLLAPRDGRRYPNLADHRKNVEYDVTRVLELMKDPPFVRGEMYAQGRWVVVPFQLKVNPGQAGVK